MIAMAIWTLKPDKLDEKSGALGAMGAFLATLSSFFIAEIGDKTQIATLALAAAYPSLLAVVAGTTAGMMIANVPVVFLENLSPIDCRSRPFTTAPQSCLQSWEVCFSRGRCGTPSGNRRAAPASQPRPPSATVGR